jgi:hypothetical protein
MAITSEMSLVQAGFGTQNFGRLLLSDEPTIDQYGAVGRNVGTFVDVSAQRDALWTLLHGLGTNNGSEVGTAVVAMQYGFAHQLSDGSFQFAGSDPTQAAGAASFFLGAFGRSYLAMKNSWAGTSAMQALLPAYGKSLHWLQTQVSGLMQQHSGTTNRLIFDAMAFLLGGNIVGDTSLIATGNQFLGQALANQQTDGSFLEAGGADTSYQAVSMLNLAILLADSPNINKAQVTTALTSALNWELARIQANGAVSIADNTRTGAGQEIGPSGQLKQVNYSEVSLALNYAATELGSAAAADAANRVTSYYRNCPGGRIGGSGGDG